MQSIYESYQNENENVPFIFPVDEEITLNTYAGPYRRRNSEELGFEAILVAIF